RREKHRLQKLGVGVGVGGVTESEWCLCPDPFSASDRSAHPSSDFFSSSSAILQNSRFINHHCRKVIGGT
ncbi:hypothetical protein TorRG33x02_279120, partial [Trema orientale]